MDILIRRTGFVVKENLITARLQAKPAALTLWHKYFQLICLLALTAQLSASGPVAPAITKALAPQRVPVFGEAILNAQVSGTEPLSYQWFFNGAALTEATNSQLFLTNLAYGHTGDYSVVVTNELGSITNGPARMTVAEVFIWGGFTAFTGGLTNVPSGMTNLVQVVPGWTHILGLRSDGSVTGWGTSKLITPPANLSNVVKVVASESHSMALQADGTPVIWGTQSTTQSPSSNLKTVDIATAQTTAGVVREDGTVEVWRASGTSRGSICTVPDFAVNGLRLAASRNQSGFDEYMLLRRDGKIVTWHYPAYASMDNAWGDGSTMSESNLIAMDVEGNYRAVLKGDGTVVSPQAPPEATNIVAVRVTGNGRYVALRNDGRVIVWPTNLANLRVPTNLNSAIAVAGGESYAVAVATGSRGAPAFVDQLGDLTAYRGLGFALNALVVGQPPLTYQWQFNGEDIVGATQPIFTLTNVQDTAAGLYSVTVSNHLGTLSGEVANLTVDNLPTPPTLLTQPLVQNVIAGSEAVFSVTSSGWPLPGYQWQRNGVNIPQATNATYVIPLVHTNHAGNYRVIARNINGSVTSQVVSLNVEVPPQPAFVSYPTTQTLTLGAAMTLQAPTTGTAPVSYRWQLNGVDIQGATGPTLGLNGVSSIDSGLYRVVASNEFGVAVSPEFTLTVLPVVAWGWNDAGQTNLPVSLTNAVAVAAGDRHALALLANGSVVAWGTNKHGQLDVPGDLTNAVAIAAGDQHSLALRADGTVIGWGLNHAGQISVPAHATNIIAIAAGPNYSLALRSDGHVVAWGDNSTGQCYVPLTVYDIVAITAGSNQAAGIRADGSMVAWGGTQPTLVMNGTFGNRFIDTLSAGLDYIVGINQYSRTLVWSAGGSYPTQGGLGQPGGSFGSILSSSDLQGVVAGKNHLVSVNPQGTLLLYTKFSMSTADPVLSRPTTASRYSQLAAGGNFNVALLESSGPLVSPQISERVAYEGGTAVFYPFGAGELRASIQWLLNGEFIPNQTNKFLILKNVQPSDMGEYRVVKTDYRGSSFGIVTGEVTRLKVVPPPLPDIIEHPVSQALPHGTNVTFNSRLALGSLGQPQWQFNGENITGATNLSLSFTNILPVNEGEYRVIFSNVTGSVTSLVASLTFTPTAPFIFAQPQGIATVPGGAAIFHVQAYGSDPLFYQWYFNGEKVSEATTSTLALTDIQMDDVGHYSVVVSNALGTVTSADAVLVITPIFGAGDNTYGQLIPPIATSNLVSLAVGQSHVLGLRADGQVIAWGNNDCDKATVPAGVSNIVRIAAGEIHSLALRSDGQVFGWGSVPLPEDLNNIVEIAAGMAHGIALQGDGTVRAWGKYNHSGQTDVPAGLTNVVAISAGARHNLALKRDGSLTAWGAINGVPASASNVIAITSGYAFNAALRGDGQLVVWGYLAPTNVYSSTITCTGASLVGVTVPADQLVEVPAAATNIVSVAAGRHHIVALRADGEVIAWGANDFGQLDLPQGDDIYTVAAGGSMSFTLQGDLSPRLGYWAEERITGDAQPIVLTSLVAGQLPVTYQWQHAGQNIPGASNAFYYLAEPRPETAGEYTLIVTNFSGSVTATVSLMVTSRAPVFVSQPISNQVAVVGDTVTFAATAIGTLPMTYRWQHDGVDLINDVAVSGADTATLSLRNVTPSRTGDYTLIVSNSVGTALSSPGILDVLTREPLTEALDAEGLTWLSGGPGEWRWQNTITHDGVDAAISGPHLTDQTNWLETTVTGPTTVSFWWKKVGWVGDRAYFLIDGVIAESIGSALEVDWQLISHELPVGEHVLRWSFEAHPVFSYIPSLWLDEVTLGSHFPPTITVPPANRTIAAGANPNFTVTATGTKPFRYQWQHAGEDIPGATNSMLTLMNVQVEDAGEYRVVVSNSVGHATSQVAVVQVTAAPPTGQILPISVTAAPGTSLSMTGIVSGQLPMQIQWQRERVDIPGQTGDRLVIENVQPEHAGNYRLSLSNQFGTTFSAEVPLDIVPVAAWGVNSQKQLIVPANVGDVVQLGGGYFHSMALRRDGTISTWGQQPFSGVITYPLPTDERLIAFAAGGHSAVDHFVGVRADGTIVNWGALLNGYPDGLSNVVAVAAGPGHDIALKSDGTVVAWGSDTLGQSSPPSDATNLVAISAGGLFGLALRADGSVLGWGDNRAEQLDFPADLTNVVAISAGYNHGLALREDGTVVTWGTDTNQVVPAGLSNVVAVTAGYYHNLALKQDGTVVAWGSTNSAINYVWPTLTNVTSIAAGSRHSLALVGDGTPSITLQPRLRETGLTGQSKLQVMVVGGGVLGYQWQRNGMDVPDATSSVLLVDANTLGGTYSVTVSNTLGFVTSNEVFVEGPLPVLLFDSISLGEDGLHLRLSGFNGPGPVVIYSSSDLVDWEPVLTNTPTAGVLEFTDPDVTSATARFYQAVQE